MAVLSGGLGDLGLGGGPSQPPQARQQPSFQDPFGAPAPSPASAPAQQDLPMLLSADKAKGLTLRGQLARMDGRIGQSFLFLPCGSICKLSSTCACATKMDRPCFCFLGVSRLVAEATAGLNTCCYSNHSGIFPACWYGVLISLSLSFEYPLLAFPSCLHCFSSHL